MPTSVRTKRRQALARWTALLQQHLPTLSLPEVKNLALWSIGIVLARSCSLYAVVLALICWLPCNPRSLLKRLQEWYLEAAAKKGHGTAGQGQYRRDWDPATVCPHLLAWMLQAWPTRQVVFVLDPTPLSDRFTVLAISILYRGCAVPVMWTVIPGGQPEAWEPHWERMLRALASHLPPGWQVLVLADRGMYSPSLFRCLVELHWHPFLRIRAQGFYRPFGSHKWLDLKDLRPPAGQARSFQAEVFKNEPGRLSCTLLAFQGEDYAEAWLLVTDLAEEVAQASWYGLRGWVEQGYKRIKGEGWCLPRTRITQAGRLERLWLAVAVATMWVLEVGGEAEHAEQTPPAGMPESPASEPAVPPLPDLQPPAAAETPASDQAREAARPRLWSVFGRGWNVLRNALAVGLLVLGSWHPEPWPDPPRQGLPPTPARCAAETTRAGSQARHRTATTSSTRVIHQEDSS
jgi:hypothetical protein